MFEILNKQILSDGIKRLDIHAPNIALKAQPGQFVSIVPEEGDERVPFALTDTDPKRGTISLIFQEKGTTTGKLGSMPINENIFSILGPLGIPADITKKGTVVCVATGIATAQMLPICRALKEKGNKVIGIVGAKTKRKLLLEAQMRLVCDRIFMTTEDGSYERRSTATDFFESFIVKEQVDMVYAIGNAGMMQNISAITRKAKIETRVQLNPFMVDCMGMCGSCRVKVGGKIVLACTEGPEFDGHKVDFEDFKIRLKAFEDDSWNNQKLRHRIPKKEPAILQRFLSGILKK